MRLALALSENTPLPCDKSCLAARRGRAGVGVKSGFPGTKGAVAATEDWGNGTPSGLDREHWERSPARTGAWPDGMTTMPRTLGPCAQRGEEHGAAPRDRPQAYP